MQTKPACLAGLPIQSVLSGTFLVTTLPAPIIAFSPIIIPPNIVELAPIDAFFFTIVFNKPKDCFARGYLSLVKVTLGPI